MNGSGLTASGGGDWATYDGWGDLAPGRAPSTPYGTTRDEGALIVGRNDVAPVDANGSPLTDEHGRVLA